MRLVRGRLPPETGGEVMINEALAKRYFGHEDPIGHSLHTKADGGTKEGDRPIVGIVNDVRSTVREASGYHVYAPETWWPPAINAFILLAAAVLACLFPAARRPGRRGTTGETGAGSPPIF